MKVQDLWPLYRTSLETLNPSPDAALEQLRWRIIRGQVGEREASQELVGRLCARDDAWSAYALNDLRRTGFIEFDVYKLVWRDNGRTSLGASLDALAGLEATAILRSRFLDMAPAQEELSFYHSELVRIAKSDEPLPIVLALQRLWLTLVTSIGSAALLSEYVKLSTTGLCYAWAEALTREALPDLVTCADRTMQLLKANQTTQAMQGCCAARAHPFTDEAKALAAAL